MYTGFHHENTLPVKAGDTVTFPKGTIVQSTGGQGLRELVRAQTVKVHHVLNGSSMHVGYERANGEICWSFEHHGYLVRDTYGVDHPEKIMDRIVRSQRPECIVTDLWLPLTNPEVCWVGSGGYWQSADINQLPGI